MSTYFVHENSPVMYVHKESAAWLKYLCIFQFSWIGIDQSQALCASGPCRYFLLFVLCYVKTKWAQMASLFIHSGREINIDQITTYYIRIHLIEQIGTYLDSSGSFLI